MTERLAIHFIRKNASVYNRSPILVLLTLLAVLYGCEFNTTTVRGKVITYADLTLDKAMLTYFTISKDNDKGLHASTARIGRDGKFAIRLKKRERLPYWLVINGVDVVPEASVTNNSLEITDMLTNDVDMGEVYIYDNIKIMGDFSQPISIESLKLSWDSDIPDVDYFQVELVGTIVVSGIKGKSFSFAAIDHLLGKRGRFRMGELEIINRADIIRGKYLLDVNAVRIINGKAVEVAGASERTVILTDD
jgi:hypothetical protein